MLASRMLFNMQLQDSGASLRNVVSIFLFHKLLAATRGIACKGGDFQVTTFVCVLKSWTAVFVLKHSSMCGRQFRKM